MPHALSWQSGGARKPINCSHTASCIHCHCAQPAATLAQHFVSVLQLVSIVLRTMLTRVGGRFAGALWRSAEEFDISYLAVRCQGDGAVLEGNTGACWSMRAAELRNHSQYWLS